MRLTATATERNELELTAVDVVVVVRGVKKTRRDYVCEQEEEEEEKKKRKKKKRKEKKQKQKKSQK